MASIEILLPWILSWEGGFSNHPADKGGATCKGVTIKTWRSLGYDKDQDGDVDIADLRLITDRDVCDYILRPGYWNPWQGDRLTSQSVANMCVDWAWASGAGNSIRRVQRLFGLTADGIVGPKTLEVLNRNTDQVFDRIKIARREFIESICRSDPSQQLFRKGWLRRLESIGKGYLRYNNPAKIKYF